MAVSITTWGRLEPVDQSTDLQTSLGAAIADPLWLLHRQWQFGELAANDAGTPIAVTVERTETPLNRYRPGDPRSTGGTTRAFDPGSMPLEPLVEAEGARGLPGQHGRLAAETGAHLLRLLRLRGFPELVDDYRSTFPLALAPPNQPLADPPGAEAAVLLNGRAVDGDQIAAELHQVADGSGNLQHLPAGFPAAPAGVLAIVTEWLAWYDELIVETPGSATPAGWQPRRFEYQFAAAAGESTSTDTGDPPITFGANAYDDGHLDWADLSTGYPDIGLPAGGLADAAPATAIDVLIPAPVSYPGMPAHRHWEIEDSQVSFAGVQAGSTDLVRMLLTDFALVYGDDWFLLPLPVTVGSVVTVNKVTVRDTFGIVSTVPAVPAKIGDRRWAMFAYASPGIPPQPATPTNPESNKLFVPPTLSTTLSGDPIEQTAYFRDEQANLVWAVERTTPSPAGTPIDRYRYRQPTVGIDVDVTDLGDADLVYRLNTPIPSNWYPYLPVATAAGNDITLQRLVTLIPDGRIATESTEVEDEEITRGGLVTERTWQFARWTSGQPLLWLGRRTRGGRGEGSSGLTWDRAERP